MQRDVRDRGHQLRERRLVGDVFFADVEEESLPRRRRLGTRADIVFVGRVRRQCISLAIAQIDFEQFGHRARLARIISDQHRLFGRDERVRLAPSRRARRPAYPVHIRVRLSGRIEVEHRLQIGYVYAARRDVGTDQARRFAAAEARHRVRPVPLVHLAVEQLRLDARGGQRAVHPLGAESRVAKHYISVVSLCFDQFEQTSHAAAVPDDNVMLPHVRLVLVCGDSDGDGIVHHLAAKRRDLARHRRRKEQLLPVLSDRGDYLAHVFDKAHLEHHVSFVEHEGAQILDPHRLAFEVIEHSADRANDDVRLFAQRIELPLKVLAAVDHRRPHPFAVRKHGTEHRAYLHREFARRAQHQRLYSAVRIDALQNRQRIRERLARARRRERDHVFAFEYLWHRLTLYRSRRLDVRVCKRGAQTLVQLFKNPIHTDIILHSLHCRKANCII